MRCASFGPTPCARATIRWSAATTAVASSSADSAERIASATLLPTPWTAVSSRNQSRSAAEPKPISRIMSWLTSISVWIVTSPPTGPSADRVRLEANTR
jgi:hypothetical protein